MSSSHPGPSSPGLAQLLENPLIWRGSRAAQVSAIPTGFAALDACLPGGGWPRAGLIEILHPCTGCAEISLLLPALARLLSLPQARWGVWVAPAPLPDPAQPEDAGALEPYAPALAAAGVSLDRMLVVRPDARTANAPLWAFEQALRSGACEIALAWLSPSMRDLRRLQLAAERGRALGVLFRDSRAANEASAAILRVQLTPRPNGIRLTLLKSRGGGRAPLNIPWPGA
jgi:cell division inhibitor SulA/protein ImuA